MDIRVSVEKRAVPVTVMEISGNIDSSTYEHFQARVNQLIAEGMHYLLIDLTHTPFVSSAGLRTLHTIFNKLRTSDPANKLSEQDVRRGISAGTYRSPHLKLTNLSPETKTTFELSGFSMFIETFDDRETALASFQAAN